MTELSPFTRPEQAPVGGGSFDSEQAKLISNITTVLERHETVEQRYTTDRLRSARAHDVHVTARHLFKSTGPNEIVIKDRDGQNTKVSLQASDDRDPGSVGLKYVELRTQQADGVLAYYLYDGGIRTQSDPDRPITYGKHGEVSKSNSSLSRGLCGDVILKGKKLDKALDTLEHIFGELEKQYPVANQRQKLQNSKEANHSFNWRGVRRGAIVLAAMGVVAGYVATALENRQDDIEYRSNLAPADLGLPFGAEVLLDEGVHPSNAVVDVDGQKLFSLTELDRSDDYGVAEFLEPRQDEELTPSDGIRMLELDIVKGCKQFPLEGGYSYAEHKILSWTTYRAIGGAKLNKYVTVKVIGSAKEGYSLEACSKPAPGVLSMKELVYTRYPNTDTVEVLVKVKNR